MPKIASVAIAGLKTTAKWVDHFAVEVYTDPWMGQGTGPGLVASGTSSAVWDGSFSTQHDNIILSGLLWDQTYYMRAAAVPPVSTIINWTQYALSTLLPGAPTVGFTVGFKSTFGGLIITVTPNGAPSDIDHYEAVWSYTSGIPDIAATPMWKGTVPAGQISFAFSVPTQNNSTPFIWLRAVNTAHVPGTWVEAINVTNIVGGVVDPTDPGVLPYGSIPPTVSGNMAYVAGTNFIHWYWDGTNGSQVLTIYRTNNTTTSVPSSKVGTNGLTSSTTYYFYPYFKEPAAGGPGVGFSGGGVGSNDSSVNSAGGAGIALPTRSLAAAANQMSQGFVALSSGGMAAQTTASSGVSGGSGGGYGGGGGCPRRGMFVRSMTRGTIRVEDVEVGEWILSRDLTWTQVMLKRAIAEGTFVRVTTSKGGLIDQSPETPMPLVRGQKYTKDLSLNDILHIVVGDDDLEYGQIYNLSVIDELDVKYALTCLPTHEFYCGANPETLILTHNMLFLK